MTGITRHENSFMYSFMSESESTSEIEKWSGAAKSEGEVCAGITSLKG